MDEFLTDKYGIALHFCNASEPGQLMKKEANHLQICWYSCLASKPAW